MLNFIIITSLYSILWFDIFTKFYFHTYTKPYSNFKIILFIFHPFRFWNDLNQTQYDTLEKFRDKILSEGILPNLDKFDDLYLLRFLRARKFDLDKTYLMFSNFIKWRKENDVENIEVKKLFKKYQFYKHRNLIFPS